MKILMCSWRDPAHPRGGGAEVYTHEVLRRWVADGHDVTWFCAAVDGHDEEEWLDGIRMVRRGGTLGVYREAPRWYREVGGGFDLVIDQINTKPFFCHQWADDAQVAVLMYQVAKEVWFRELPLPIAALGRFVLEPRWLAQYRYVPAVTISDSSRESLVDYGFQRVLLAPPATPIPPDLHVGRREDVPTVLFVGRLAANKRPDHALEAFEELRLRRPDARLWIVGDGPYREQLERFDTENVTFFGKVSERRKYELMARAHALVVTSTREGWGMVVTEAATVGTRAVAYDVAGLRDSVADAGGRLCPTDPAALADELDAALDEWTTIPPLAHIPTATGDWDVVAADVFAHVTSMCPVPVG